MKEHRKITYRALFIFTLGFIAGIIASQALTNHIETEVASRIDDVKVLQSAGFIPDFVDSTDYAVIK